MTKAIALLLYRYFNTKLKHFLSFKPLSREKCVDHTRDDLHVTLARVIKGGIFFDSSKNFQAMLKKTESNIFHYSEKYQ